MVDPVSPTTIYALTIGQTGAITPSFGLFKSTDSGGSWRAVSNAGAVLSLAVDPKNSSILYAGTLHGIIKSLDSGTTWSDAGAGLPDGAVQRLVIDPISRRPYSPLALARLECP